MRQHRSDLGTLCACAVPVLAGLYVYVNYQATGQLPLGLSSVRLPAVGLPDVPAMETFLPGGSNDFTRAAREHGVLILFGTALGLLMLIMLIGIIEDFLRARKQTIAEKLTDTREQAEDPMDAPWLYHEAQDG
jgi:hypothetical protein